MDYSCSQKLRRQGHHVSGERAARCSQGGYPKVNLHQKSTKGLTFGRPPVSGGRAARCSQGIAQRVTPHERRISAVVLGFRHTHIVMDYSCSQGVVGKLPLLTRGCPKGNPPRAETICGGGWFPTHRRCHGLFLPGLGWQRPPGAVGGLPKLTSTRKAQRGSHLGDSLGAVGGLPVAPGGSCKGCPLMSGNYLRWCLVPWKRWAGCPLPTRGSPKVDLHQKSAKGLTFWESPWERWAGCPLLLGGLAQGDPP